MTKVIFALAVSACAAGLDTTPDTAAPVAHEPTVMVGGYLNDEATPPRIGVLLEGIQWEAVCSLGCTLYVQASRADAARARLRTAIANEHLTADVQ